MPNYNYRTNDYMRRNQRCRPMNVTSVTNESECNMCTEMSAADCCMNDLLNGMPIAMSYVSWQEWRDIHPAEKALCRGTIFEELDKPFLGIGGCSK